MVYQNVIPLKKVILRLEKKRETTLRHQPTFGRSLLPLSLLVVEVAA